jgi:hypothetical protein
VIDGWTPARSGVGLVDVPARRRWFFLATKLEPDRDTRRHDEQAMEEIRRLFARYRTIARHGQAIERDQPADARDEAPEEAPVPTTR